MQYSKGYKIKDKRNYNSSFIAELLEKLNIKVSFQLVNIILKPKLLVEAKRVSVRL